MASPPGRLIDYFLVLSSRPAGGDAEPGTRGSLVQRFPRWDHQDYPIDQVPSMWCLPYGAHGGVVLPREPMPWVARLMHNEASAYAVCLAFASWGTEGEDETMCLVMVTHHAEVLALCASVLRAMLATYGVGLAQPARCSSLVPLEALLVGLVTECPAPQPGQLLQIPLPLLTSGAGPQAEARLLPEQLVAAPSEPRATAVDPACVAELLRCLPGRVILRVVAGLLAARSVVLVSSSRWRLSACSEAFSALLCPVEWICVRIGVAIPEMVRVVTAPVPFLCGVLRGHVEAAGHLDALNEVCVVDLDEGTLALPQPSRSHTDALSDLRRQLRRGRRAEAAAAAAQAAAAASSDAADRPGHSRDSSDSNVITAEEADMAFPRFPEVIASGTTRALDAAAAMLVQASGSAGPAELAGSAGSAGSADGAGASAAGSSDDVDEEGGPDRTLAAAQQAAARALPGVMSLPDSRKDLLPGAGRQRRGVSSSGTGLVSWEADETVASVVARCAVLEAMIAVLGGHHQFARNVEPAEGESRGDPSAPWARSAGDVAEFDVEAFLATRPLEVRPLAAEIVATQAFIFLCQHTQAAASTFARGRTGDSGASSAAEASVASACPTQRGVYVFIAAQDALAAALEAGRRSGADQAIAEADSSEDSSASSGSDDEDAEGDLEEADEGEEAEGDEAADGFGEAGSFSSEAASPAAEGKADGASHRARASDATAKGSAPAAAKAHVPGDGRATAPVPCGVWLPCLACGS
ncbi:hypothetical protein FNF27_01620 [Cafeteria roenbergensis]|uniref:UDENN domain-containing protein n=2 Tax=Cafeteria roenbergensis TaxID=33653 RepID=A0A5A8EHW9_CAFRO|nr:hypothetical protein FNF27_01620 [Cafeteria roenbergensis]